MGELIRRRGLIPASSAEKWDYEWDYTMGLLSANGWAKNTSGNAQETLVSTGVRLASSTSAYVRLSRADFNVPSGVLEVLIYVHSINTTSTNAQNNRICIGNGTNGIQIFPTNNQSSWRLMDKESPSACTVIAPFSLKTDYLIRLELDNGIGKVFINGELIRDNIRSSSIVYSANTSLWSQNQSELRYGIIKEVRFKIR